MKTFSFSAPDASGGISGRIKYEEFKDLRGFFAALLDLLELMEDTGDGHIILVDPSWTCEEHIEFQNPDEAEKHLREYVKMAKS